MNQSADPPWPFQAGVPERYFQNYARYLERGGQVNPHEDVRGFVAAEPGNGGDIARFYFFCLVLDQLMKEGITGDVAELGVYKGATASLLAKVARTLGTTAYLLDTFQGFSAADLKGVDAGQPVQFTDTSLEAVRQLVGEDHVRYIKGYFPETASQLPLEASYCLVHIDCDLQAPMQSALEYFYPRLVPGGFLITHDYSSMHWAGVERAVDQFFADKPESPLPLTDGAGSAVIRKAKPANRFDNWYVRRRVSLLGAGWVSAANNGIGDLLGSGWSEPEAWGVWGIGPSHELLLYVTDTPGSLSLEVDAYAVLAGHRRSQEVEVWVGAHLLGRWGFDLEKNRAVRRVEISASLARDALASMAGVAAVKVEFRPQDVTAPSLLDSTIQDGRPLGLGVCQIRLNLSGN